jgi:large subunit ribosomal protein L5
MDKQKKEKQTTEKKETKPVKKAGKSVPAPRTSSGEETTARVPARLFDIYRKEIVPELKKKFGYTNNLEVPRLSKISVNVGAGSATQDPKILESIARDVDDITGQKSVITKAKKSVSNFKLREGMKIGCKVTLRKSRMYEFLDKLINISLPRIRDFRGISDKSFDGNGNFTIGIKEHVIFPEINIDKVSKMFGLDITFVTTAKTDEEAYELLRAFGIPFIKKQNV